MVVPIGTQYTPGFSTCPEMAKNFHPTGPGWAATSSHFLPVGNPALPISRNPDSVSVAITSATSNPPPNNSLNTRYPPHSAGSAGL
ncbi:MAG: hypothetical protein WAK86_04815, partial [Pseudonocardiaceae bacterium]